MRSANRPPHAGLSLAADDATARALLPGGAADGLQLVLFCDGRADGAAIARFRRALPAEVPGWVVDVAGAPATARYFGVRETPVLAAVADGSLLMLESDCGESSCAEVISGALDGLRSLAAG